MKDNDSIRTPNNGSNIPPQGGSPVPPIIPTDPVGGMRGRNSTKPDERRGSNIPGDEIRFKDANETEHKKRDSALFKMLISIKETLEHGFASGGGGKGGGGTPNKTAVPGADGENQINFMQMPLEQRRRIMRERKRQYDDTTRNRSVYGRIGGLGRGIQDASLYIAGNASDSLQRTVLESLSKKGTSVVKNWASGIEKKYGVSFARNYESKTDDKKSGASGKGNGGVDLETKNAILHISENSDKTLEVLKSIDSRMNDDKMHSLEKREEDQAARDSAHKHMETVGGEGHGSGDGHKGPGIAEKVGEFVRDAELLAEGSVATILATKRKAIVELLKKPLSIAKNMGKGAVEKAKGFKNWWETGNPNVRNIKNAPKGYPNGLTKSGHAIEHEGSFVERNLKRPLVNMGEKIAQSSTGKAITGVGEKLAESGLGKLAGRAAESGALRIGMEVGGAALGLLNPVADVAMAADAGWSIGNLLNDHTPIQKYLAKGIDAVADSLNGKKSTFDPSRIANITGEAKVAASFLADKEGMDAIARWDKTAYTIGHGHQIKPNELAQGFVDTGKEHIPVSGNKGEGTTINKSQAKDLLEKDIAEHYEPIAKKAMGDTWDKLNDQQKAALISYAYNTGPGGMEELAKKIRIAINSGDMSTASELIANGRHKSRNNKGALENDSGLQQRRTDEAALFSTVTSTGNPLSRKSSSGPAAVSNATQRMNTNGTQATVSASAPSSVPVPMQRTSPAVRGGGGTPTQPVTTPVGVTRNPDSTVRRIQLGEMNGRA